MKTYPITLALLFAGCAAPRPAFLPAGPPPLPPRPAVRRAAVVANGATVTNLPTVTLAWDASTDPTVTGYRVYSGASSRSYTNMLDVGMATTASVSNLIAGQTYYFAATTYNAAALESAYSVEVSWSAGATIVTNVVTITSQVLTAGSPGGPWTGAGNPVVTVLTNPPGIAYFQTSMTIGQTNVASQVLKLDRSTLVITNK